ncbi:MAG: nucleotidyltransferase family protein [Oscillospiraceae bacterium]|nr:nucleotidyltransferase family protein [Oscillospiraceae bacterium]
MNTLQRGILLMLKSAVTGEPGLLPEGFSLEEALPVIKKHHLAALAYQGGSNCGLEEMSPAMLGLMQAYCRLMLQSEAQMAAVARLCGAFEEKGIDYMPLKGINMKSRYPKPELRIMGDADILIRAEQYDAVRAVVEGLGYAPVTESDHEYVWSCPELQLELHKRLIPSYNSDYYAYFGDGWRLAKRREDSRYAMTPEDEWVYLFTHFAKHYRDGGIGCRHVLDLWVYLRSCPGLDEGYIRRELQKLELLEFHENVGRLLEFWFGDGAADEKLEMMTDFIFDSGSWGKWESHVLAEEVKNRKAAGSVQGGRARSARLLLFPEARDMALRYPILNKAPWLLPVMWPVRWVEAALFRRERVRKRGRDFRSATAEKVDAYQRAMNRVGLDFRFPEPAAADGDSMKVVFASNYFNHHQKPLCDQLYGRLGERFRFVATTPVPQARQALGYGTELPSYVVPAYADAGRWETAQSLIDGADAVIAGSVPEAMLRGRVRAGKLLLRYSERPFKEKRSIVQYLPRLVLWHWRSPMTKPIYMLCASAYTAPDYAGFGLFRGRCYRWGYFPETKRYADTGALMEGKDPTSLLWAGRMIDWKHPDDALEIARRLRQEGYDFTLTMIGMGSMERQLRERVEEYDLADRVWLPGAMKPEEVRAYMEKSGIYLLTSDRKEGWGAVLNESMNSGCAVVACEAIGSVPYLIRDGQNGLTYGSGDLDGLYERVKYLLDHPEAQRQLGTAACRTITESWNAETAAPRLLELIRHILAGEKKPELYADGPVSRDEGSDIRTRS